jgi:hypothetical protein
MGRQSDIDDLFRRRLYDAEATPPPFVWLNVEAALRKRKRRWFFFSLLAAGFAGAGLWYIRSLGAGAPTLAKTEIMELQPSEAAQAPGISDKLGSKPSVITQLEPGTPVNPTHETPVAVQHTRSNPPAALQIAPTPRKMLKAKSPEPWAGIPKKLRLDQAVAADFFEKAAEEKSIQDLGSPPKADAAQMQHPENNPETFANAQNLFTAYIKNSANTDTELAPEIPLFLVRDFDRLPFATGQPVFVRKHRLEPIAFVSKKSATPKRCYSFAKDTRALLVDVYGGPSLARKELTVGNAENKNYLQRRLSTEKQDWAFNLGVRGTYVFQRNLLLRSGLHYDQNVEVFEHFDPNSVKVVVEYRTKMIGDQKITTIDTLSIDYGEEYIKSYNRFGMLELPLVAGLELRAGNTGLSINGGVSLNLLFWKRGAMLGPDGKPAWFSKGRQEIDVFRNNTGLSLNGSVQWFWHLRPRLRVFVEPYTRHILKPVSIPGYPIQQRGGFWGLRVGMTKIVD